MTLYTLNILDLLFTLYAVSHGGVELNPIMANPTIMVLYKTIVVGALCWWLSTRSERIAVKGVLYATVSYAIVDGWHLYNILGVNQL